MIRTLFLALAALLLLQSSAAARIHRNREIPIEFEREHPCPSTGLTYGACPGFIRDHLRPLCAGGEDSVRNMAWEETLQSEAKDEEERRLCRMMHRRKIPLAIATPDLCRELDPARWPLLTGAFCITKARD